MTAHTSLNPVAIARTVFPLSTSHTLAVPLLPPLTTSPLSRLQHTHSPPRVCPVHLAMTFPVSTSHNLTAPSLFLLATFFPSRENDIVSTRLSPSRPSFP